ncbi:MAG: class I SAM-dependent methyltransferase [Actinomycetota bacterium]|nr:class I SAM-dependent methyltransferase [Actinomycetota bacterium]MDA2972555.1 class I SAM-dependent methyltransferase [Actinomycetota bacterium]MDA3000396.1 class I SAM-dependent methyltransferase [Actinomycetota bacterium]
MRDLDPHGEESAPDHQFGAEYYRRFYGKGGVHDRRKIAQLASAVHGMCAWWGVTPHSVLDVGAGLGLWRDWYRATHPRVKVVSTDISEHACAKYSHEHRDIASWTPSRSFDLVICHGVLQYPDDVSTTSAISNLAAACRHVLYLEVPTSLDFRTVVDPDATDMDVNHRSGKWYRERLDPYFKQAGSGLWVRRGGGVLLYELERSR